MSCKEQLDGKEPSLLLDVVWLKRDVRLVDHGPISAVLHSNNAVVILYLFEPDQLSEPTVHGSHLSFIQEGLIELDKQLAAINIPANSYRPRPALKQIQTPVGSDGPYFQCLTVCHAKIIDCLDRIHNSIQISGDTKIRYKIARLLAHQETGHLASFARDKQVGTWCRNNGVVFDESFNQNAVTRCLKSRDDFSKIFARFMAQPQYPSARKSRCDLSSLKSRLVVLRQLPGFMAQRLENEEFLNQFIFEIPDEDQRQDRLGREQKGGECHALAALHSFLYERGSTFSQDISSPNTSWTSCSRLSAYLSWGHISLRHVIQALRNRQEELRQQKKQGHDVGPWLKSMQAFSSRLHWRSHFMQKLESEPELEKRDLCPAYQHLRRMDGDWSEDRFQAWSTGRTGFPFVDACMRCLLHHGWINFRMRAMLISFATYNCWLDWSNKALSSHMARVFLDYEPGIHYPQLQMQAGTTGINAMRVYSVTKQGKDQDPKGVFIRRYVPELAAVPDKFIHEPWTMPINVQQKCKLRIGDVAHRDHGWQTYPAPIVDEKESARIAKARISAVRKQESTQTMAQAVYQKHGSRNGRRDATPRARSSSMDGKKSQPKITDHFFKTGSNPAVVSRAETKQTKKIKAGSVPIADREDAAAPVNRSKQTLSQSRKDPERDLLVREGHGKRKSFFTVTKSVPRSKKPHLSRSAETNRWPCNACTFLNENPMALACSICGTER